MSHRNDMDIGLEILKNRIVFLNGAVNEKSSSNIIFQLLYLNSLDSNKPIKLYINSPGGVVTEGMAIYDTMNLIENPVSTICIGQASSMGAFLLSAGEPGYRYSLPHSRIMIHQPLGGAEGQASDIEIRSREINRIKKELNEIMAKSTNGKTSYQKMVKLTDRDNFLSPSQALELGLIDKIISKDVI
jgi:ATP-dependent Clp protease protease subunit